MFAEHHTKRLDKPKHHDVPRLARMYCRQPAFTAEMGAVVEELHDLSKPSGFAWESRTVGPSDIPECPYGAKAYAARMSTPRMPMMNILSIRTKSTF